MAFEKAKLFFDGIQAVAVVIGIGFAIHEAKTATENLSLTSKSVSLSSKATTMATWNAVAGQWLDLDKAFTDRPELNQFFYNSADPSTAKDRDKVEAMGQYVLDFIDNALILGNLIKDKEITHLDEWVKSFDYLFIHAPVVCNIFKRNPTSYSTYTRELAKRHDCDG